MFQQEVSKPEFKKNKIVNPLFDNLLFVLLLIILQLSDNFDAEIQ